MKHKWSMNGHYIKMQVPTREAMEKLGIVVPDGWDGMRLWKGRVAEQLDDEGDAGLATMRLLVGGDIQFFVDFDHAFNAPVKEWIQKEVKAMKTNWTDVKLPNEAEARALLLAERERSAKIRQEGYALRGAADAAKQGTDKQNQPEDQAQ